MYARFDSALQKEIHTIVQFHIQSHFDTICLARKCGTRFTPSQSKGLIFGTGSLFAIWGSFAGTELSSSDSEKWPRNCLLKLEMKQLNREQSRGCYTPFKNSLKSDSATRSLLILRPSGSGKQLEMPNPTVSPFQSKTVDQINRFVTSLKQKLFGMNV